jgi:hypothetical protein
VSLRRFTARWTTSPMSGPRSANPNTRSLMQITNFVRDLPQCRMRTAFGDAPSAAEGVGQHTGVSSGGGASNAMVCLTVGLDRTRR